MKKLIVMLLLIACFAGCKTVKETSKTREKTEFSQQNDVKETAIIKAETKTNENATVQANEEAKTVEETVWVKWSVPDSTGKQYMVETATKTKGSQINKVTNTNIAKVAEIGIKTNIEKEDKSKSKGKTDIAKEEKTETKKQSPTWVMWVSIILSIGLLVFIYMMLKRFKLIK